MSPNVFILMGVSASGKTTLGKAFAEATGGSFFDGDDYHSQANQDKMAEGQPLTDLDRKDWLESLANLVFERSENPGLSFIACSALKESYREILRSKYPGLVFIFLKADPETLRKRITERYKSGEHFMPPELLDSQLETLEPPDDALEIDSSKPISELVTLVLKNQELA